ncbi:UDP-N-acetylglucosamine 2-epimerase [Gammaproteobacteria bacterium]|nr:UDP-N-acetylglucosamine 2-epimerase [Gammaproteobacteria bacterium]
MKRTIGVFTGNRAEYGLQYPILRAIDEHPDLDYKLFVSGAHLDSNFGRTLDEIASDGFHIDAEIKIEMDALSLYATAQAIGSGVLSISNALEKLKPDMFVVYADRFEGLAAVLASTQMKIPTAHIEGGDLTEGGALDDSVRHAMTKLAHLHFTTNSQASNRILGMGEEDWRVNTVGFPAIDLISEGNYASPEEIVDRLNLDLQRPIVLFTQHSVTTFFERSRSQIKTSLEAIRKLSQEGIQFIITYPNNDAGGQQIIEELENFKSESIDHTQVHLSLGRYLYHGILGLALNNERMIVCVGNSSSGLKETPAFQCPTVNIGDRQDGRLRGDNVIDAKHDVEDIVRAIHFCIENQEFRQTCKKCENPYWIGDAGVKIAKILAETDLNDGLLRKKMTLRGDTNDGWFR